MSNPDPQLQKCIQDKKDSKIKVERDGRKVIFDNSERDTIKCVDLDCWIQSTATAKADFVVSKPGVVDVIVELKGKDIKHAADQIVATLSKWRTVPPFSKKISGLIVFTRCPMSGSDLSDLKKRLLSQHGLWMEIDKDQKTEYRFEVFTGKKA